MENNNIDEFAILEQTARGDDSLFQQIIEKHSKPLLNFIYRFTLNTEEAEDLCQELFLRIYQNAGKFKSQAKFSTILYKIASNLCIDYFRRRKTKNSIISFTALETEVQTDKKTLLKQIPDNKAPHPQTILEETEKNKKIQAALQSLPESQRLALILKIYDDKSYAEIAEIMEISVPAIESLLFRARQNLKIYLQE